MVNSFKESGNQGVFPDLHPIHWKVSSRDGRSVGIDCAVLFTTHKFLGEELDDVYHRC